MSPSQQTPPPPPRRVNPCIWRSCAGNSVQTPTVHSRVYYFPQGHVEQLCNDGGVDIMNTVLSPLALSKIKPLVPCLVSAVNFLADPISDEVFAKLTLQPVSELSRSFQSMISEQNQHVQPPEVVYAGDDDDKIVSFAKILTASDANNGGGFSVPRFCADSVFPPLNFNDDPPVQTLSVTDVHGAVWNFRHIYRGTPRRHLLTTGWSKFVNSKRLIAGDSVVFMRNNNGDMFIGVRRVGGLGHGGDSARWGGAGGSRDEAVRRAVESAAEGLPFEVVYYPSSGWSDFVVRAEVVESSLNMIWSRGMRVKMSVETEDSSRMSWFQGRVESAMPHIGSWPGSPWRMLQVLWDEPEVLKNAQRVSPWQVELVSSTPQLQPSFNTPAKKIKYSQNPGFLMDGDGGICFPMTGFNSPTMGHTNLSLLNYHSFPAGMQGARQSSYSFFSISDFISENTSQGSPNNIVASNTIPKSKSISNELNITTPQSDKLSPDSQTSVLSYGMELLRNERINSTEADTVSFQLFGKVIQTKRPHEGGSENGDKGCTENDGMKGYYAIEDIENSLHASSAKPCLQLLDRLDVPLQTALTDR